MFHNLDWFRSMTPVLEKWQFRYHADKDRYSKLFHPKRSRPFYVWLKFSDVSPNLMLVYKTLSGDAVTVCETPDQLEQALLVLNYFEGKL